MTDTMEVTEPQTLDQLIKEGIQNALASPTLTEAVKKHAEKAVSEAISSAFGYGSKFREGVEAAVKSALPTVDEDDLAAFAVATREVIQRRLGNLANETARIHLDAMLEKILPTSTEVTFDELEEAFRDKVKDRSRLDGCHCDDDDSPAYTWDVEESGSCDGYWDVTAGIEPNTSRYSGKDVVNLRFRKVKDTANLHECWHASVGSNEIGVKSLFAGPLYGFDALVFRLATGQSKLRHAR